jgi:hypothetical protein
LTNPAEVKASVKAMSHSPLLIVSKQHNFQGFATFGATAACLYVVSGPNTCLEQADIHAYCKMHHAI